MGCGLWCTEEGVAGGDGGFDNDAGGECLDLLGG